MASKVIVNLDTNKNNYVYGKCKQNDDLILEANIYENSTILNLENKEILIQAGKKDISFVIQNTDIIKQGNKIKANLDRAFTTVPGIVEIEIVLVESGKQNTTFSFYLDVIASSIKTAIEKSNTITILEELENKVIEAVTIKEETENLIKNGGAATKGDIVKVNSSLEQNTKQLVPNFYDGAIVTFIDDDCYGSVSKWETIASEKGIKISFAMVKDWVGTNGYCNLEKIKSLQNNGHDILNHTKSHINNWNITNGEIRIEIEENIKFMKENELNGYDILVYPGTVPNESRYKTVAREKCRYGIANTYQATNKVQDSFYMNRIDSDFKTLDQLKSIVDQAIIDKQWVLVLTHSWRDDGDINSTKTFSIEKIKQLIDYIKSKNIPILKFTEAEKYKGNSVSIGDYETKDSVYISKDGRTNIKTVSVINSSLMTKINTDYEPDHVSFETIRTLEDTFLNKGGVLQTFRSTNTNFTFQLYFPWDDNSCYKRRWIEKDNSWSEFDRIDTQQFKNQLFNKLNNNLDNTLLMDAPITSYDIDMETTVLIRGSNDTFKSVGGIMKVFRSSQKNFSYATYIPYNESDMYIRHWGEHTIWGEDIPKWTPWVKIGN